MKNSSLATLFSVLGSFHFVCGFQSEQDTLRTKLRCVFFVTSIMVCVWSAGGRMGISEEITNENVRFK